MLTTAFGRERVAILKKGHVVVPSDASGIIYLPFNNHVKETAAKLCQRLGEAGFDLSSDAIAKGVCLMASKNMSLSTLMGPVPAIRARTDTAWC